MPDFEVRIEIEGGSDSWYTEHRFDGRPDMATVRRLRDDAATVFDELYPETLISDVSVSVSFVDSPDKEYVVLEDETDKRTSQDTGVEQCH